MAGLVPAIHDLDQTFGAPYLAYKRSVPRCGWKFLRAVLEWVTFLGFPRLKEFRFYPCRFAGGTGLSYDIP
jgi:hypothetical protein